MKNEDELKIIFNLPKDKTEHIIKVIGVGGGGSNAVKNMYETGITNVSFVICNTDSQALSKSPVPIKVQLGDIGLGVGGDPQKGREEAEKSINELEKLFDDETQMVFITAGMGGGTGTGASPVIAQIARKRGLLTIGVVTLPFVFEKRTRIEKALAGIEELKQNVDALLVINNERLLEIYDDNSTTIVEAFKRGNEVLTTATKTIAEIITEEGIINRDFCDVKTVMENSGAAIVSTGYAEGDNRILRAMTDALRSPLLNTIDIEKTQRLLYIFYQSEESPITVSELTNINQFMDTLPPDILGLWGLYSDESLGKKVKVAIIATGFDQPKMEDEVSRSEDKLRSIKALEEFYYPNRKSRTTKTDAPEEAITVKPDNLLHKENGIPMQTEHSWIKKIIDFAKKSLEEEEEED